MSTIKQDELLREAFKYRVVLETYAYGILLDWALAEDAVQETFVQTARKWDKIKKEQLLSWLKKVAHDKAVDIIRKRKKLVIVNNELSSMVEECFYDHSNNDLHKKIKDQESVLQYCVKKVKTEPLEMLLAFYNDRKSCETLAKQFNKSTNNIRVILSRTRDKLRDCARQNLKQRQE